jgi:hypothetical protein
MTELLDRRIRAYVEKLEPAISGQSGHDALFKTSCVLVWDFGLSPEEAWPHALEYNARCMPPWSEHDLRRKLLQALNHSGHQKPRGYLLGDAHLRSADDWQVSQWQERPPKPSYRSDKLQQIAAKLPEMVDAAYLEGRSVLSCWNRSPAGVLAKLYQPGEKILIFTNWESQGQELWTRPGLTGNFAALDQYKRGFKDVWFLSNPVDGEYHWNPRQEKDSRRSEESVTSFRYAVVESDKADPGQWLRALVQLPLFISAIYESGKRSIHALLRTDAGSKAEWDESVRGELLPILTILGADPGSLTAVRLTRLPNCKREETGKLQRLLYLDPEPDGEPIRQKPVRGGTMKSNENLKRFAQEEGINGDKPQLILPCPSFEINQSARRCFTVLAKTQRYFTRDRTVFEVVRDDDGGLRLVELDPAAFRSQLEDHFRLVTKRIMSDGTIGIIANRCSVDSAIAVLKSDPAFAILPRIKVVTAAAVFTETDGKIEVLNKGYHNRLGGILVTRKREITDVPLDEATAALFSLLDDFDFVSQADGSRTLASFISPALRLAGLLDADFPIDLSEANESQSGKTYRQKVVCGLYGERPYVLNKTEDGGVGSLDERASDGLISGQPFLMIENVRGPFKSQLVESALRGAGLVQARRAYSRSVQVKTDRVCWMLSSNKADTTPDLANRSIITRILKQLAGYNFKRFEEGDLLRHVEAKSDYYLSCILSVLREWHSKRKPRTDDTRHDFREWCQTLDWIVQNIFQCPPLLDGHRGEQLRISNPDLNWLREIGFCAEKDNRLGDGLKPGEIVDLCEAHGVDIPGCQASADDTQRSMAAGRILKRLFSGAVNKILEAGGYLIRRESRSEYNHEQRREMPVHYHFFERQKTLMGPLRRSKSSTVYETNA